MGRRTGRRVIVLTVGATPAGTWSRARLWRRHTVNTPMSGADNTNSGASERAADVLGHLYALAAAHISGDQNAVTIILEDVPAATRQVLPEAALAIAYTSVRMFRNGDDPFDDPLVAVLPPWILDTLASVLGGEPPDLIPLHEGDPVDASIRTVGAFWLWAAYGEQQEALRIARRHCANMVLYRDEGWQRRRNTDEDDWN
jgi:hypothetical protein